MPFRNFNDEHTDFTNLLLIISSFYFVKDQAITWAIDDIF